MTNRRPSDTQMAVYDFICTVVSTRFPGARVDVEWNLRMLETHILVYNDAVDRRPCVGLFIVCHEGVDLAGAAVAGAIRLRYEQPELFDMLGVYFRLMMEAEL